MSANDKKVELLPTRCAICGTEDNAAEFYPANFDLEALNPSVFSARRLPDRLHYRLVRCNRCGLVRSDPVAAPELLESLYSQSRFEYGAEVANLKRTYRRYLAKLPPLVVAKGALLEIGCGNGFFLEEARALGFSSVQGVEPSRDAIAKAADAVREQIVCGVMRPGLFDADRFDVICLMQVFDHVPDPGLLLDECRRILKPDGAILLVNHNVEALSARLLGERSPIVDIEHTYLYSLKTVARLVKEHGFKLRAAGAAWNRVSFHYLARLLPLPDALKRFILDGLQQIHLGRCSVWLPLGNLWAVAKRT